jgi:hypothetical protein
MDLKLIMGQIALLESGKNEAENIRKTIVLYLKMLL